MEKSALYDEILRFVSRYNQQNTSGITLMRAKDYVVADRLHLTLARFETEISASSLPTSEKILIDSARENASETTPLARYLCQMTAKSAANFIEGFHDETDFDLRVIHDSLRNRIGAQRCIWSPTQEKRVMTFNMLLTRKDLYENETAARREYRESEPNKRIAVIPELYWLDDSVLCYQVAYFVTDAMLVQKAILLGETEKNGYFQKHKDLYNLGLQNGYVSFHDDLLQKYIDQHIGKPYTELEETIAESAKTRAQLRTEKEARKNRPPDPGTDLTPSQNLFLGFIVCMDKKIDIRPFDFAVRLLCSSSSSFENRHKVASKHKKEIVAYVMREMQKNKRIIKKVGSLSYYEPSSIRVLRTPEIEVLFSVKQADTFYNE